jgi:3-deoxy-D-manno-octulosonic-acid transferase
LVYGIATRLFTPFAANHLRKRAEQGKEEPARLGEKLGEASLPRPDGRLIWLHAASVGESLSVLELVRRLREARGSISILVTTGTVTSAALMEKRLPAGAFHQYAPLDIQSGIARFLAQWQPDLVIWTESEFWPNTLKALYKRNIVVLLINARLSRKSFRAWRWFPFTSRRILRRFTVLMAQNAETARRLTRLGARSGDVQTTGSLKEGAAPLPHDLAEYKSLKAQLQGRQVWCAASTHPGEEEMVAQVHRAAQKSAPGLVLILVPRHPDRGDSIVDALRGAGWSVAQRSSEEAITGDTEIYVADTLGELGLWYRLAPVSFLGGSLTPIGGHNPYEPAALGSAVLHGPHIENFADAYERLGATSAARCAEDAETLAPALIETLRPDRAAAMAARAWDLVSEGAEATDTVLAEILKHLDALAPQEPLR